MTLLSQPPPIWGMLILIVPAFFAVGCYYMAWPWKHLRVKAGIVGAVLGLAAVVVGFSIIGWGYFGKPMVSRPTSDMPVRVTYSEWVNGDASDPFSDNSGWVSKIQTDQGHITIQWADGSVEVPESFDVGLYAAELCAQKRYHSAWKGFSELAHLRLGIDGLNEALASECGA